MKRLLGYVTFFFLLSTSYVHKIGIINFGYHLRKLRLTELSKFSQVLILMTAEQRFKCMFASTPDDNHSSQDRSASYSRRLDPRTFLSCRVEAMLRVLQKLSDAKA